MESWALSNPKRDVSVCECSGNNIKLSQCQSDISRHVQAYGLSINRDEISDEMDLTLRRAGKKNEIFHPRIFHSLVTNSLS